MATVERVTVTLPNELVSEIDRREKNRSKFVAEAVRHELERRRRARPAGSRLARVGPGTPLAARSRSMAVIAPRGARAAAPGQHRV